MRTLVLGDVHGAHKALEQVLERASFDPAGDRLVFLGDVCDGWSEVPQAIGLLLETGAEAVWGNHDQWAWQWMLGSMNVWELWSNWISQGGRATYEAFNEDADFAKTIAAPYFHGLNDYIYDEDRDYVYVHGGIPLMWEEYDSLEELSRDYLTWDRDLFLAAVAVWKGDAAYTRPLKRNGGTLTPYSKVFIGHTTTTHYSPVPIEASGVVCMDTGGGWEGKLSLMDVDSGEVWQSDKVEELYPEERGRR